MKKRSIRVAVIEDDVTFRNFLEQEIRQMPSCTFEYGIKSLSVLQQEAYLDDYNPDVLLLDMALDGVIDGGMKIMEFWLKRKRKLPKILIISGYCGDWMLAMMRHKKGVSGCILKSVLATAETGTLEKLIIQAHETNNFIEWVAAPTPALEMRPLTEIQTAILTRLRRGETQKQIAEAMTKPVKTIGNHVDILRKKLKSKTTAELLSKAENLGLFEK